MTYNIYDENDNIKVLFRNAVKCLVCNKVIESKYQHNFVCCGCKNETCVDGGLVYQRVLGKDLEKLQTINSMLINKHRSKIRALRSELQELKKELNDMKGEK